MTQEIRKGDWQEFFDRLSRDFLDWETSVQVMNDESGVQMLSEGLPFSGLTLEEKHGHNVMELRMGFNNYNHLSHNISDPTIVAFEPRDSGGMLDIEDESGTKTLINFMNPMPVLVEYVKSAVLTLG